MNKLTAAKQKIVSQQVEIKNKINSIELEAHWFRRVFHTFAASFLVYYLLPDDPWITTLKTFIAVGIAFFAIILEYLRIKGIIRSSNFFGLRIYEEKKTGKLRILWRGTSYFTCVFSSTNCNTLHSLCMFF